MLNPRIEELVRRDPRYAPEAYEFVFEALSYANKHTIGARSAVEGHGQETVPQPSSVESRSPDRDPQHVSVPEFFDGLRELALREFGLMAPTVFNRWGVHRTDDFGEIVFTLIGAGLLDPTTADDRDAFRDHFDLGRGLVSGYEINAAENLEDSL